LVVRKLVAYALIVLLIAGISGWIWYKRRRERLEKERRHGPRED